MENNMNEGKLTKSQYRTLRSNLAELPELQSGAASFISPSRSGSGSPSSERSIGFNVSALDYSMGKELLGLLHKYEALIRRGRSLTPPALLDREATVELEVAATVSFHLAHLEWTVQQDWVEEFAGLIKEVHAKGLSVTKRFVQKTRRIPCPTDRCEKKLAIDIESLMEDVKCLGCHGEWTVLRLIQLALSNPDKEFLLDIETICLWLGDTEKNVMKVIKANNIKKKSGLYNMKEIMNARVA
jgi:hypothetical protein